MNILYKKGHKKNLVTSGIFLFLPFALLFIAILIACIWVFNAFIVDNLYFRLIVQPDAPHHVVMNSTEEPAVSQPGQFPATINYEDQWATLNVDGWAVRDIPVVAGDSYDILDYAAGQWFGSRFCGQGGKIVICAHVTDFFEELEGTPNGTLVTMETTYGRYVYQVRETIVFNGDDGTPLYPDDSKEELLLYTCYPRDNGWNKRVYRVALLCDKIEGADYNVVE